MWPFPTITLFCQNIKKKGIYPVTFFHINNLSNGIFLFCCYKDLGRTYASSKVSSLPGLCPVNKFKLKILHFCLLSWINLCLPVLHQHWLIVRGQLAQCRLLSLWVQGCWVSASSDIQLNLGHNTTDRGVPKDGSCRIGGVLVIHDLRQVYIMDCCRVQGSSLPQWQQLTMQCMVSLILTPEFTPSSVVFRCLSTDQLRVRMVAIIHS